MTAWPRVAVGRPFHSGKAWATMDLALKGMSMTLASGPPEVRR